LRVRHGGEGRPVLRALARAVRLAGGVVIEDVEGHAFLIHERFALGGVRNLRGLRGLSAGDAYAEVTIAMIAADAIVFDMRVLPRSVVTVPQGTPGKAVYSVSTIAAA
jgi:hypothetical protein